MPSYGLTIRDTASPLVDSLLAAIQAGGFKKPIGEGGKLALMEHLAKKNADPGSHRTGAGFGRPGGTGLYFAFARATSYHVTPEGVLIVITHAAARQRYEGGRIRPVNKKKLAIPARSEAYGVRAQDASVELKMLFGRRGPIALVAKDDYERTVTKGPRRGQLTRATGNQAGTYGQGGVWYWLVDEVNQKGDKTVLPDDADFITAIEKQLQAWWDGLTGGPNG